MQNLTSNKPPVNAKSALSVLTQAVNQGHEIAIDAQGESAEAALAALKKLIEGNFGESQGH